MTSVRALADGGVALSGKYDGRQGNGGRPGHSSAIVLPRPGHPAECALKVKSVLWADIPNRPIRELLSVQLSQFLNEIAVGCLRSRTTERATNQYGAGSGVVGTRTNPGSIRKHFHVEIASDV